MISIAKKSTPIFSYRMWASISALLFTCFLLFIDEGYNDFTSFTRAGNIIPGLWYFGMLYLGQILIHHTTYRKTSDWQKPVLNAIIGLPLGLILAISSIGILGLLVHLF